MAEELWGRLQFEGNYFFLLPASAFITRLLPPPTSLPLRTRQGSASLPSPPSPPPLPSAPFRSDPTSRRWRASPPCRGTNSINPRRCVLPLRLLSLPSFRHFYWRRPSRLRRGLFTSNTKGDTSLLLRSCIQEFVCVFFFCACACCLFCFQS